MHQTGFEYSTRSRPGTYGVLGELVERLLASALLLAAMPVFLAVTVGLLITDGRPILFKNRRLGHRRRPFNMYKFRTLREGAQSLIGAQVLSDRHPEIVSLSTPFGRFLRHTRLDELPQLWNVLKGEMSFFGPRPVRPEIFESLCDGIRGSSVRFSVKPGLVGYAQLFTPHGSSKALRIRFTNRLLSRQPGEWERIRLALYAGWRIVVLVVGSLARSPLARWVAGRKPWSQRGEYLQQTPDGTSVAFHDPRFFSGDGLLQARLTQMSRETFVMNTPHRLHLNGFGSQTFKLKIGFEGRDGQRKRKVATCMGIIVGRKHSSNGYSYQVAYQPASPMNQYLCDQYFLRESIAPPFRTNLLPSLRPRLSHARRRTPASLIRARPGQLG